MCFGETKEVCEDMVTVGTSSVRGYTGYCMDAALDDGQCAIVTMPVSGYQPFLKVTLAGSDDASPDKTPPIKCDPDDKVCNEINKALGDVYESKPTQEMFEQKVELTVDAENTVSEGWGSGGNRGRGRSARPPGRPGHRPGRR